MPVENWKLLALHVESLVNYSIEMGYGRRYGDSSCIARGMDCQIRNLDDLSLENVICVPILLFVSCFLISVTTL